MRLSAEVPPQHEAGATRLYNRNLNRKGERAEGQGRTNGSVWNSSTPHAQACGFFAPAVMNVPQYLSYFCLDAFVKQYRLET